MSYMSQPSVITCYSRYHLNMFTTDVEKQIKNFIKHPSNSDQFYAITERTTKLKVRIILNEKHPIGINKNSNVLILTNKPLNESSCLQSIQRIALYYLGSVTFEVWSSIDSNALVISADLTKNLTQYHVTRSILFSITKLVD